VDEIEKLLVLPKNWGAEIEDRQIAYIQEISKLCRK